MDWTLSMATEQQGEVMAFDEMIRVHRQQLRHMTQADLAEAVGISAQYLNDIERGRRPAPAHDVVVRLAETLDIPVDVAELSALASREPDYAHLLPFNRPA